MTNVPKHPKAEVEKCIIFIQSLRIFGYFGAFIQYSSTFQLEFSTRANKSCATHTTLDCMNASSLLLIHFQMTLHRRHSYETSQIGDNTYATILPRSIPPPGSGGANGSSSVVDVVGGSGIDSIRNDLADYATLRNNDTNVMPPAVSHFNFQSNAFFLLSKNKQKNTINYIL